jgi:uncharacterized RDD family membrane protein YckC
VKNTSHPDKILPILGTIMTEWYYAADNRQAGPVSEDQLRALMKSGQIRRNTLVWRAGLERWKKASQFDAFADLFPATPPPAAIQPSVPVSQVTQPPIVLQPPSADASLARPWPRLWARYIDVALFLVVLMASLGFAHGYYDFELIEITEKNAFVAVLFMLPVVSLCLAVTMSIFGTTPGKAFLGIRVVKQVGWNGFVFHLTREFMVWISGLGFGLPIVFLFTMFHQYRRVAAGNPTGYDEGFASVQGKSSALRVLVAVLLFIGSLVWVIYSGRNI